MSAVFLSLLLIFELIQQSALVNFLFYLNIFKILKLSFSTFLEELHISCLVSFYNSTMQTATTSKAMIKFWSKFQIQILLYSFSRDNRFLITHSHSLPGKQENPFSSASRHINNSLSKYLFSSILNSIMVGWKYRSRKLFLSPKEQ